ncbi:MAG: LysR family transcriptional regulator [Ramlibacter sp.]|nr:LysR family transcriptional regulator [Ramlibacter sp.]
MSRQFDDVMLGSIELFCLAAELQSFTAAATAASLTPAAVSRSIGRLEDRMGVRLFVRTTRRIRLTEGGRTYLAHCRQALNQLAEAGRELTGQQAEPSGVLRMSVPTPLGHYRVLPLLPAFRARYPLVQVDVQMSNRNIDLIADGFDLAVRARAQPDSGLVARKLMDAPLVVVAAPAYLARAGVPQGPQDLLQHECIQFRLPSTGLAPPWALRVDGADLDLPTQGGYSCTEDLLGTVTLARAGAGLVQTYRFIVEDDLRTGALVEVLPGCAGRSRPFSLLYPQNRHMPRRVRVFVDFLMEALASEGPAAQATGPSGC